MRLIFNGFERPVEIQKGAISELVIENKPLLARVVQSLATSEGEQALEPYCLFDDEEQPLKPGTSMLLITSPFALPWDDKRLMGAFYKAFESRLLEEEEQKIAIDCVAAQLRTQVAEFGLSFQSDYDFAIEWDIKKFLKSFGYKIEISSSNSLLDNLIQFLALSHDTGFNALFIFVCLEEFLDEESLKIFCEQSIFYGREVLLINGRSTSISSIGMTKYCIDQHLCEI